VNALTAHNRWCLTSTPIQNSLEDLEALLKFLKMPIFAESTMFRKHIILPTKTKDRKGLKRFENLRKITELVCFRRTRASLGLLEPSTETITVTLSPDEHVVYSNIAQNCRRAIAMVVGGRKIKETNQIMLESILRMRLFCNDGSRAFSNQRFPLGFPSDPQEALSFLQTLGDAICSYHNSEVYSLDSVEDDTDSGVLTICHHLICGECLPKFRPDLDESKLNGVSHCPFCPRKSSPDSFFIPKTMMTDFSTNEQNQSPMKLLRIVTNIKDEPQDEKR
jgi:SWI/SNF-related matrix-associated actin-dependent regulator of chromatin subfamily A3